MKSPQFWLPPQGILKANNPDDPLDYYYLPLVGALYVRRINLTLRLLTGNSFGKILEIGYGSGVLMPTLCQLGSEVYGVDLMSDPDATLKRLAQLNCAPILSRGVSDRLLFSNETFDLVVAISVLEHIRAIRNFLVEIHRILKPGGVLLVGMPAVNKTMEYLFQAIGYSGIAAHHCTSPEEMYRAGRDLFTLQSSAHLPGFLPRSIYLYKAFCLIKPL